MLLTALWQRLSRASTRGNLDSGLSTTFCTFSASEASDVVVAVSLESPGKVLWVGVQGKLSSGVYPVDTPLVRARGCWTKDELIMNNSERQYHSFVF